MRGPPTRTIPRTCNLSTLSRGGIVDALESGAEEILAELFETGASEVPKSAPCRASGSRGVWMEGRIRRAPDRAPRSGRGRVPKSTPSKSKWLSMVGWMAEERVRLARSQAVRKRRRAQEVPERYSLFSARSASTRENDVIHTSQQMAVRDGAG